MRRIELRRGIFDLDYDQSDPEALRVRRAIVGGYRDYLEPADREHIRRVCESDLSAESKELLARTGAAHLTGSTAAWRRPIP